MLTDDVTMAGGVQAQIDKLIEIVNSPRTRTRNKLEALKMIDRLNPAGIEAPDIVLAAAPYDDETFSADRRAGMNIFDAMTHAIEVYLTRINKMTKPELKLEMEKLREDMFKFCGKRD